MNWANEESSDSVNTRKFVDGEKFIFVHKVGDREGERCVKLGSGMGNMSLAYSQPCWQPYSLKPRLLHTYFCMVYMQSKFFFCTSTRLSIQNLGSLKIFYMPWVKVTSCP